MEAEPTLAAVPEQNMALTRLFELYVDRLTHDLEVMDDALLVRLRILSEDADKAIERIAECPDATVATVRALSSLVQELDAEAGAVAQQRENVTQTRNWAVLLPSNGSSSAARKQTPN